VNPSVILKRNNLFIARAMQIFMFIIAILRGVAMYKQVDQHK
jgi:hypothetical protein